jgi:hypothetical protein
MFRTANPFRSPTLLTTTLLAMLLCACAKQLAPAPDPSLNDGIRALNMDIMNLYAITGGGVTKETCPQRLPQYNRIIGNADALALQSQNRPVPDSATRDKIAQALRERMTADAGAMSQASDSAAAPVTGSAFALTEISRSIRSLQKSDCAHGLSENLVTVNRQQVQHFMSEALFYEYMLQR